MGAISTSIMIGGHLPAFAGHDIVRDGLTHSIVASLNDTLDRRQRFGSSHLSRVGDSWGSHQRCCYSFHYFEHQAHIRVIDVRITWNEKTPPMSNDRVELRVSILPT